MMNGEFSDLRCLMNTLFNLSCHCSVVTSKSNFVKMGFAVTIMYTVHQAPLVQKVDNSIHWINLFPVDEAIDFPNTYPLDSYLSGGLQYPTFEQPEPVVYMYEWVDLN